MMLDIEETFQIKINNMYEYIEHLETVDCFAEWMLKELEETYGKFA